MSGDEKYKIPFINSCIRSMAKRYGYSMKNFFMADNGLTIVEALDVIYNSETYAILQDADTGIYIQSPSYVYELLNTEYHTGALKPC